MNAGEFSLGSQVTWGRDPGLDEELVLLLGLDGEESDLGDPLYD